MRYSLFGHIDFRPWRTAAAERTRHCIGFPDQRDQAGLCWIPDIDDRSTGTGLFEDCFRGAGTSQSGGCGGRDEIVKAVKNIANQVKANKINSEDINEKMISDNLYTAGQPDPDLVIRTSGELRLSNFLPWQAVYSELLFVNKNWPDFTEQDLDEAIIEYQKRTRKFGAN